MRTIECILIKFNPFIWQFIPVNNIFLYIYTRYEKRIEQRHCVKKFFSLQIEYVRPRDNYIVLLAEPQREKDVINLRK